MQTWIFHRDAVKMIRKLKTGDGQYLWQAGIASGQPNTILDRPYLISEYMSNTFTSGLYCGIVGDFAAGFWIVEGVPMKMSILTELFATTDQIAYVGRQRIDAAPVDSKAFARVTLA